LLAYAFVIEITLMAVPLSRRSPQAAPQTAEHADSDAPPLRRQQAGARPYDGRVGALRLGRISYVNMAPVFHRLEADVEEVAGVPTALNRALLQGECDLAPISSIEYARNADRLRILPRLCVGSEGAVDSIQLVSRMPLEHVRTVAVTPESATSVVLTKVLLPEASHVPLEEKADARLLIGDAALQSAFEDPTPHHDLGRLWLERTGLPMVFAVWAAPEPLAPGLPELEEALVASVRRSRAEPELLAREASERYGYPAGFLARYFEKLRYSFGPRERAGLLTFLELARDVGELDAVPELRFVTTTAAPVHAR
jgi:chorismate dehydratase